MTFNAWARCGEKNKSGHSAWWVMYTHVQLMSLRCEQSVWAECVSMSWKSNFLSRKRLDRKFGASYNTQWASCFLATFSFTSLVHSSGLTAERKLLAHCVVVCANVWYLTRFYNFFCVFSGLRIITIGVLSLTHSLSLSLSLSLSCAHRSSC